MGTAWPNTRPDDKQAGGGRYCRRRAADHAHRHRPQDPCGWPPSHQPRHAPVHAAATSQRAGDRPRQRVPGAHPGGRGPVARRPRHPHRPQRRDLPSDGLVGRRAGSPGVHAAPLGRVPGLAGRPAGRPLPRHHAVPVRRPVPCRLRRLPDGGDVLRRHPSDLSPALPAGAVPGRLQLLPGGRAAVRPPPGHLRRRPVGTPASTSASRGTASTWSIPSPTTASAPSTTAGPGRRWPRSANGPGSPGSSCWR